MAANPPGFANNKDAYFTSTDLGGSELGPGNGANLPATGGNQLLTRLPMGAMSAIDAGEGEVITSTSEGFVATQLSPGGILVGGADGDTDGTADGVDVLAAGTAGQVLTIVAGVPTWVTPPVNPTIDHVGKRVLTAAAADFGAGSAVVPFDANGDVFTTTGLTAAASGGITVVNAGSYLVNAKVCWATGDCNDGLRQIDIMNGATSQASVVGMPSSNTNISTCQMVSAIVVAAAGDTIDVRATHSSAEDAAVDAGSYLHVHRIAE